MKRLPRLIVVSIAVLLCASAALSADFWGSLQPGPYAPGFKLIVTEDASRTYESGERGEPGARPIRLYLWYPAREGSRSSMDLASYLRLAAEEGGVPIPIVKGVPAEKLESLKAGRVAAVADAEPADGKFPLLVVGQGLYYESPFSHFVLCEYLASHGYVVATCPLVGTLYRLVNLTAEDLETEIRDMEFVMGKAEESPFVDAERIGVVGYDLGGIAGIVLSMRRPDVDAYLSLDAAILKPHWSGLPNSHSSYREDRFVIPWMHMTQGRFIESLRRQPPPLLADRKQYGDTYLVHVPTANHGQFSSYAMLGIDDAVPGYWGPIESDARALYESMCRLSLDFFDAYLKGDRSALDRLADAGKKSSQAEGGIKVERKKGQTPPPSEAEIVNLIIEKGMSGAAPVIEQARKTYPDSTLCSEGVLNWLGYHFLLWWGREREAIEVFELNVSLYPASANAYDSLGEAYMALGETEKGIASYRKSLELNPQNEGAAQIIKEYESRGKD